MNIYAVPNFLAAILILATGYITYIYNPKSQINTKFFYLTIAAFVWLFGTGVTLFANSKNLALIGTKISFIGIALIPVFSYHLALCIAKIKKKRLLRVSYVLTLFLFIPLSWIPRLIFDGVNTYRWGFFFRAGVFHPFFMIFFATLMFLVFYNLFISYRNETNALQRNRKKYFWIALIIAYTGTVDFLPTYGIYVYPFGYFAVVGFVLIFAYAIKRYNLMDVRVAVTKASIFIVVYSVILLVPFILGYYGRLYAPAFLDLHWWIIPVSLMAVFATAGPFIYNYLGRQAENKILADQKRYQEALLRASEGMLLVKELNRLLKLIVQLLVRTIGLNYAAIYLQEPETAQYTLRASRARSSIDAADKLDNNSSLARWLEHNRKLLLYEEIEFNTAETSESKLLPDLRRLKGKLIVPAVIQEHLIGFFVLGDKLSGSMYTKDDLAVFQVLANQASLAIENAIFYEETGKTLTEQFHEHRLRSIGKMGSYMGHQINNRFQAVLVHAERIKYLILKKLRPGITAQQKPLIDKAEESLDIIAENAKRGGAIVDRLKAFSRKDTVFKPVGLDEVMKSTIELLSCKFDINELNIKKYIEKSPLKVYGDIAQLQDVFFNLLDNAHDAQQEKKASHAAGYVPETIIKAYARGNKWYIEISDNGIGIKEEELEHLFLPFFTTKATSEKGTGIGMAVIKMMIENNKGTIKVDSQYGKGTVFYITLPGVDEKERENG